MRALPIAIASLAIALAPAWGVAQGQAIERGRVIDRDTGKPIPFAAVAATYMGSVAYRGSGCNRVEGVVADAEGWFVLPKDAQAGPIMKEAYSRGYGPATSPRYATNLVAGDPNKWIVAIGEWDPVAKHMNTVRQEPTVYRTKAAAAVASRQFLDIYMTRFIGTPSERLMELQRLAGAAICGGGPQTTKGPIEFLDAIYREQVELGASADMLRGTIEIKGFLGK